MAAAGHLAGDGRGAKHEHETEEERRMREDREEKEALLRIINAFRDYHQSAEWEVARWQANYRQLPPHHKALLGGLPAKFAAARQAIQVNAFFVKSLLQAFDPELAQGPLPPLLAAPPGVATQTDDGAAAPQPVSSADVDKVRYVLKNVARDWSEECAEERAQCYGPILGELRQLLGGRPEGAARPRVLVPGAGLARLCCEIASLGFEVQGNEFSYFMLLASSFLLNATCEARQFTLHPWLHSACNHWADADQLRPVAVPDVLPEQLVASESLLSMCAGDFVEVYSSPDMRGAFDALVTCFFIDTAHNVLRYLEVINAALKVGGYWINLGPLLYHWADSHMYLPGMELSIEVSLDDIRAAAQAMGFKLLKESRLAAPYMANVRSMYKTVYDASFWTMVKVADYQQHLEQQPQAHINAPPPPPPPLAAAQ